MNLGDGDLPEQVDESLRAPYLAPGSLSIPVPGDAVVLVRSIAPTAQRRPRNLWSLICCHHTTVVNWGPVLGQFTVMSQVEPVGKLGNQSLAAPPSLK